MRTIIAVFLAVCLAGGSSVVSAQGTRHPGQPARQRHAELKEKLNLSDAQDKKLDELRTDMQRKAVELRSKIQLDRIDLRELLRADAPDRNAIERKVTDLGRLQTERKMLGIDHLLAVRQVLTPEQREIMKKEFHNGWMRGFRNRSEFRHGRMMNLERMGMEAPAGMYDEDHGMVGVPHAGMQDDPADIPTGE